MGVKYDKQHRLHNEKRVKMMKLVQKLRVLQNTKDWKAKIPARMRILVNNE